MGKDVFGSVLQQCLPFTSHKVPPFISVIYNGHKSRLKYKLLYNLVLFEQLLDHGSLHCLEKWQF